MCVAQYITVYQKYESHTLRIANKLKLAQTRTHVRRHTQKTEQYINIIHVDRCQRTTKPVRFCVNGQLFLERFHFMTFSDAPFAFGRRAGGSDA